MPIIRRTEKGSLGNFAIIGSGGDDGSAGAEQVTPVKQ